MLYGNGPYKDSLFIIAAQARKEFSLRFVLLSGSHSCVYLVRYGRLLRNGFSKVYGKLTPTTALCAPIIPVGLLFLELDRTTGPSSFISWRHEIRKQQQTDWRIFVQICLRIGTNFNDYRAATQSVCVVLPAYKYYTSVQGPVKKKKGEE